MEIVPATYYNLKRYWRRRRYQRLNSDTKKKMRVARLGGVSPRRIWKLRSAIPKLRLMKFISPIKLLTKFQDAYVDMMYRMAGNVASVGKLTGKKVTKAEDSMATCCGEEVDSRLVLEIYKSLAASRQLAAY